MKHDQFRLHSSADRRRLLALPSAAPGPTHGALRARAWKASKARRCRRPGFYVRDYNVVYYADRVNDPAGAQASGRPIQAFIYANVPRVLWITDTTVPRRLPRRGCAAAARSIKSVKAGGI